MKSVEQNGWMAHKLVERNGTEWNGMERMVHTWNGTERNGMEWNEIGGTEWARGMKSMDGTRLERIGMKSVERNGWMAHELVERNGTEWNGMERNGTDGTHLERNRMEWNEIGGTEWMDGTRLEWDGMDLVEQNGWMARELVEQNGTERNGMMLVEQNGWMDDTHLEQNGGAVGTWNGWCTLGTEGRLPSTAVITENTTNDCYCCI
ncbi:hypothetical protein CBR_g36251 [Chara braunii]|uniref:Uncharacterized protein n=1 Tax=Chara braunii TaxID=69332 RepID=A0A388LKG9_CHABU|nr:hypothetical protein CBR_g36251 [Chara braunii]|eukprot:GBG82723.1 hypothetical protein CBR_g36251 [Chara braunii]